MLLVFVLALQCLALQAYPKIAGRDEIAQCFREANYITCEEVEGRSSKCDCGNQRECHIHLTITREPREEDDDYNYLLNGEQGQGPTIVADYDALVVVDIHNKMDEETSIHWHGIHQYGFPWMDGVGNITQYAIKPYGRFRYIFRASPQGTHWYHSHIRFQRDTGLLGVLIVREKIREQLPNHIIDVPESQTLVLQEIVTEPELTAKSSTFKRFCLPDGSPVPMFFKSISLAMNGRRLPKMGTSEDPGLEFYVEPGQQYRFRVLAAMSSDLYSISIDHHKMHVIATDGFLVREFKTDFLIMHVSERYDFIVKAKSYVPPGARFAIRIQTLAEDCESRESAAEGFAELVYSYGRPLTAKRHPLFIPRPQPGTEYTVLNCPMQNLPDGYYGWRTTTNCHDVTSLRLRYPTDHDELPSSQVQEAFFDFFRTQQNGPFQALVNGVHFTLPNTPLVDNSKTETEGCRYPVSCSYPGEKLCTHAIYFGNESEGTMRFVLSALAGNEPNDAYNTHPIHMHGHSYFVAKVAYPEYYDNGTIKNRNQDVTVSACGPGHWTDKEPSGISVNRFTVRKDVITVPAGGYVVIDFIADNPGYWLMHCHIDGHLNNGMAVALGENIDCASTPPDLLLDVDADNFCISIDDFKDRECRRSECKYENCRESYIKGKYRDRPRIPH